MSDVSHDLMTIPEVAELLGMRVDRLRRLIRRLPAIQPHIRRIGPSRTISAADLPAIARALMDAGESVTYHGGSGRE